MGNYADACASCDADPSPQPYNERITPPQRPSAHTVFLPNRVNSDLPVSTPSATMTLRYIFGASPIFSFQGFQMALGINFPM